MFATLTATSWSSSCTGDSGSYPDADADFLDALSSGLRAEIPFELVDTHVNDAAFADLVAERYLTLVSASLSTS